LEGKLKRVKGEEEGVRELLLERNPPAVELCARGCLLLPSLLEKESFGLLTLSLCVTYIM
jgi:hypothetical protein